MLRGADASRVHLVGHSFGAAGVCLAARERRDVASASLLDPWSTPLDEEAISRGVGAAPLLAVLSDGWARGPEAQVVRRLISASEGEGSDVVTEGSDAVTEGTDAVTVEQMAEVVAREWDLECRSGSDEGAEEQSAEEEEWVVVEAKAQGSSRD